MFQLLLERLKTAKFSKLLSKGFKKPIYWNGYKIIFDKKLDANEYIRERLDDSIQGVKRLFVLAYGRENDDAIENSHKKCFLPRMKTKKLQH